MIHPQPTTALLLLCSPEETHPPRRHPLGAATGGFLVRALDAWRLRQPDQLTPDSRRSLVEATPDAANLPHEGARVHPGPLGAAERTRRGSGARSRRRRRDPHSVHRRPARRRF